MAKWYGTIGFGITEETSPGVYTNKITEKQYYGDVIRNTLKTQNSDSLNDNLLMSIKISILADPFANENISHILYTTYMGVKWKVEEIEPQFPRLILSIGGVYTG